MEYSYHVINHSYHVIKRPHKYSYKISTANKAKRRWLRFPKV